METVYADDKNVTGFDVSWIPHDGAMDSSCNVYITDWTKLQHILSWLGGKHGWESENSADASATTMEYPRFSRYFAQRRVLHFHDCAQVYAADKNVTGFDVSWIHDGAMDSSDPQCLHHWFTKLQHILRMGSKRGWRISENSADASATVQNIPRYFAQRRVFTSMTVHMETVYAEDKNVTGFDVSYSDGAMDSSTSNVYITGLDEATNIYFGWAKESAGISANSADASATTVQNI
jgi:uncharacterized protein YcfJ